ncbi:MAG: hypothetical protein ACK52U_10030 [Synechococcaceae cyanobacterium]
MELGIVDAVWPGSGVELMALFGWLVYSKVLNAAAMIGLALIVVGILGLNLRLPMTLMVEPVRHTRRKSFFSKD